MKYIFVDESWEDYLYWQKTDKKIVQKINDLINGMIPKASFGNIIPQQTTGNYTTAFSSAAAEREGGLKDISRNPFSGLGKPEALKYKYKGFWSRRIDGEHRLIYQIKEDEILIAKCRFHYD